MYEAPEVKQQGNFSELTLDVIQKQSGTGDVIVINGQGTPVPGGSVDQVVGSGV